MAQVGFVGGDFSVAKALVNLNTVAARPNFELQFSILQNRLLDRISDKIEKFNDDTTVNNVDAFLTLESKRLGRLVPLVEKFESDTTNNYLIANGLVDDLNSLEALASGGNAATFDDLLGRINADLQKVKTVNGLAIGLNVKDGLTTIQSNGMGISDYASYGDNASRETAVSDARAQIEAALAVLVINLDAARDFKSSVQSKTVSVTLQIEAVQIADKAEKLGEIEKLREESGQLLQILSLAFETNLARSQALSDQLLNPPKFNNGTILDLLI